MFSSVEDMRRKTDSMDLDVDENSVLVLQGCGPRGYPGFPEVGNMPLPKKLVKKGVRDMVRVSDARMSGTAYGTVVLHVAPESTAGGPLAVVRTGDDVTLDVGKRQLELNVSPVELQARLDAWKAPEEVASRGYVQMYTRHVLQVRATSRCASVPCVRVCACVCACVCVCVYVCMCATDRGWCDVSHLAAGGQGLRL